MKTIDTNLLTLHFVIFPGLAPCTLCVIVLLYHGFCRLREDHDYFKSALG